jgi:hypothetical protein
LQDVPRKGDPGLMAECVRCGRTLTGDEIGIYRKLINRAAKEFFCKDCLARHFNCDVKLIDQKIAQFRAQGCTLFVN